MKNLKSGMQLPCGAYRLLHRTGGGALTVMKKDDELIIDVIRCPSVFHAGSAAIGSHRLMSSDRTDAQCLSEGTPFEISTCIRSEGTCRKILRGRHCCPVIICENVQ